MKIILAGELENISTRQDGTLKFTFGTQEIDPSTAGNLFQLRGKFAKCLLSDNNITQVEEEIIDAEKMATGKKVKSHSQRLRAVLYRYWEHIHSDLEFEDFYKGQVEGLIEHFKNKLD